MASRGTRGPSPQTEPFHRPTGKAENGQEKNIKSEIQREREEERDSKRETMEEKQWSGNTQNVCIMSGIGMTPHWGLLVSSHIQW